MALFISKKSQSIILLQLSWKPDYQIEYVISLPDTLEKLLLANSYSVLSNGIASKYSPDIIFKPSVLRGNFPLHDARCSMA